MRKVILFWTFIYWTGHEITRKHATQVDEIAYQLTMQAKLSLWEWRDLIFVLTTKL